jgi:hypothetical protein
MVMRIAWAGSQKPSCLAFSRVQGDYEPVEKFPGKGAGMPDISENAGRLPH